MTDVILRIEQLTVRFGGIVALSNLHLAVRAGSRHGILGPNGSGKTTVFNAITGLVTPAQGRIMLAQRDITRVAPHTRVRLGLARTFQITSLFPALSARENVLLAAFPALRRHQNPWRAAQADQHAMAQADRLLQELGLEHLAGRPVMSLGYGEQRQLEIALALATQPRVLLLDEPTAGLSAAETDAVVALIRRLPQDLTVVLIEHDLRVIFDLTDHLTVLAHGERIADGPAAEAREDPVVKEVYLGG